MCSNKLPYATINLWRCKELYRLCSAELTKSHSSLHRMVLGLPNSKRQCPTGRGSEVQTCSSGVRFVEVYKHPVEIVDICRGEKRHAASLLGQYTRLVPFETKCRDRFVVDAQPRHCKRSAVHLEDTCPSVDKSADLPSRQQAQASDLVQTFPIMVRDGVILAGPGPKKETWLKTNDGWLIASYITFSVLTLSPLRFSSRA